MIPYSDVIENADRRWTARLLARLDEPDLPEEELDDLVGALQAVSDPRALRTLEKVLVDSPRPARISAETVQSRRITARHASTAACAAASVVMLITP